MSLSPDMQQWLRDNREDYEFYMLHAIMHDPLQRSALLATPVVPGDFRREEYALVIGAIIGAVNIGREVNRPVPAPPTPEDLRTYLEVAAKAEALNDEIVRLAMALIRELQIPSYKEQHYCVSPYFEAWYGGVRAKQAARDIQMDDVPDVHAAIGKMQAALAAAAQAAVTEEDDGMTKLIHGTSCEKPVRRSSGIPGLDICLNGGWGKGECYLLFGGTGSGKSLGAAQCAWHEASVNKGYAMIVSTELWPHEYAVRIVSNACGIPISILQDCENFLQIRQAVSAAPSFQIKLPLVDKVLKTIADRIRIHKISADDGMEARGVLERETLRFRNQIGEDPTWACLDWLGSVADLGGGGKGGTSERAMAWEISATGCVKFAEVSGIPTMVLAQAVNDAQLKRVLTINDIGVAKGIGRSMTLVVGITNSIDSDGIKLAVTGKAEMPKSMILEDQLFCVCKARKGEGNNIPVRRDFRFQRFEAKDTHPSSSAGMAKGADADPPTVP